MQEPQSLSVKLQALEVVTFRNERVDRVGFFPVRAWTFLPLFLEESKSVICNMFSGYSPVGIVGEYIGDPDAPEAVLADKMTAL